MTEPKEPLSELMEATVSQHEMFLSWIAAGFTDAQALELLKVVIAEVTRGAVS